MANNLIRRLDFRNVSPEDLRQMLSREWLVTNGIGALATAVVTLVFVYTKFPDGAWIVVLAIPVLVAAFTAIHRHYTRVLQQLRRLRESDHPARCLGAPRHSRRQQCSLFCD